jgi:type 1 glutamine amidotransferase
MTAHTLRRSILTATFIAAGAALAWRADPPGDEPRFRALVFSKTAGFRHDSIPDGVAAIEQLGKEHNFTVHATEAAGTFTGENLENYDVVIFLSTTGDVLDLEQQRAFETFIRNGGGYAGIHAAADTEYDWPWYGRLVGAYFKSHPKIQEATIIVEDREHRSCNHLASRWVRTDEWYNYRDNPRDNVEVLLALDESTYEGGESPGNDGDHPIAWCHEFDGGRAWYTGCGHTKESFKEPEFLKHLLGGIEWAAGASEQEEE